MVLKVIEDKKYASKKELEEIDQRVKDLVNECVEFGEESDFPEPQDLYKSVYSEENYPFIKNH